MFKRDKLRIVCQDMRNIYLPLKPKFDRVPTLIMTTVRWTVKDTNASPIHKDVYLSLQALPGGRNTEPPIH